MDRDLYLLWVPNEGWGVFNASSCPDPGAFPEWMYRKYTIPGEKYYKASGRLKETKERLDSGKVISAKEMENEIFPELSDLLED